ncbi:MAG: hypothetical protein JRH13_14450 [Deltaproteobacteria bacterium]|nr:hypothetical protein [Deltaproteobacteria bacterium]MBW2018098.1 hypothetical protein [Deltaproteobacteria bacterium]MBW2130551.1 hypothetical protein [Deltaproteobacteria bacterium]MBW2304518.1 hypothetical protein [Deltaproteobacteria bacterium]
MPSFKDFRITVMGQAESQYLRDLMTVTHWNVKKACRISGLSRPRLYALLKKHGIQRRSLPELIMQAQGMNHPSFPPGGFQKPAVSMPYHTKEIPRGEKTTGPGMDFPEILPGPVKE